MKYQVEFYYQQKYFPTKRCKKERVCCVKDVVEVEVQELTGEAFPVAFIVRKYESVYEDAECYEDFQKGDGEYKPFTEEIRRHDGTLFKVMRISSGAAISGKYFEPLSGLHGILKRSSWCSLGADEGELPEGAVLRENNRDVRVEEIVAIAKQYVIYDGRIWKVCGEPTYQVSTFGLGHNHGGTSLFIQYCYDLQNHVGSGVYNALERELALETARKTALGRGDTNYVDSLGVDTEIEVLIPEAVTLISRLVEREVRNDMFRKLKPHIGHRIVCVSYGDAEEPVDICIECEDCGEVLVSAEDFDESTE